MSNPLLDNGLAVLEFARHATLAFLDDVPANKASYQPVPGANHALWVIGHITVTDNQVLADLAKQPPVCPAAWGELFGPGSKPQPDAARYPSLDELRRTLGQCRERLVAWFKSLPPDKLLAPLPGDWSRFAPNHAALMASLAWHEGLHAGQITVVRKSLGLAPKFA